MNAFKRLTALLAVLLLVLAIVAPVMAQADEQVQLQSGVRLYLSPPDQTNFAAPTAEQESAAQINQRVLQTVGRQLTNGWWLIQYPATDAAGNQMLAPVYVYDPTSQYVVRLTPPTQAVMPTAVPTAVFAAPPAVPTPAQSANTSIWKANWPDNAHFLLMGLVLLPILWFFVKDQMMAERKHSFWVLVIGLPLYFLVSLFTPVFTTTAIQIWPGVYIAWAGIGSIMAALSFAIGVALIVVLSVSAQSEWVPDKATSVSFKTMPSDQGRQDADAAAGKQGFKHFLSEVPAENGMVARYYQKLMRRKHRESSPITVGLLGILVTAMVTRVWFGMQFTQIGFPKDVGLSVYMLPFLITYVAAAVVQAIETYFEATGLFWRRLLFMGIIVGVFLMILPGAIIPQQLALFVPVYIWLKMSLPDQDFKSQVADWLMFTGVVYLGGVAFGWPILTRVVNPLYISVITFGGEILHLPQSASLNQYITHVVQAFIDAWSAGF